MMVHDDVAWRILYMVIAHEDRHYGDNKWYMMMIHDDGDGDAIYGHTWWWCVMTTHDPDILSWTIMEHDTWWLMHHIWHMTHDARWCCMMHDTWCMTHDAWYKMQDGLWWWCIIMMMHDDTRYNNTRSWYMMIMHDDATRCVLIDRWWSMMTYENDTWRQDEDTRRCYMIIKHYNDTWLYMLT